MALFSRKEDKKAEAKVAAKVEKKTVTTNVARTLPTDRNLASVIIKPRITEKSVNQGEKNVYTFIVRRDATKHDVSDAIQALYKVTPVKVNIVNKAPRQFMSRGRGRKINESGMKKAYVYLKAGDSISLV